MWLFLADAHRRILDLLGNGGHKEWEEAWRQLTSHIHLRPAESRQGLPRVGPPSPLEA